MPVHYDTRNKRWRFRFRRTIGGRQYRATQLLPAAWGRAEAEAFDRQECARLYGIATGVLRESPSIERAVHLYLTHHEAEGARNIAKCTAELARFQAYYAGRTFEDLPAIAQEYTRDGRIPDENGKVLSAGTIRNRLAYLRAAVRWAWKHHGMGEHDPGARMLLPKVHNERHEYLQPAEVYRLAKACRMPATRAIVRLAFWTGLRWTAELLPRQPSDIVRSGGVVYLVAGTTKNGEPRMVPVHPDAVADLKHLPFTLHWRTYSRDFDQARVAVGLPHIRLHDLRHSVVRPGLARQARQGGDS